MDKTERLAALKARILAVQAIAEAIRTLGRVPSGELYVRVAGHMSIDTYNKIIDTLKNASLVSETAAHELVWIDQQTAK